MFANDNFLLVFNIGLTLGRYYVEAPATGSAFNHNYCQPIQGIATNFVVGVQQPRLNGCCLMIALFDDFLLLFLTFRRDLVQFLPFGF